LTLVSTSGNTATFNMSINTNTKSGWVSIVAGGTEVARKYVGAPVVTGITGSTSVPNGQYAAYHANVPSESSPANYQWILNPQGNNNLYGASTASLDIAFYTAGSYQLVCRAYNSCGWGDYKVINLNVYNTGSYSIAYPNPAANYLTVSFNPELVAQTQASLQSAATGAQATRRTFLLSVKLYDQAGVVRRQTTSTGQDASLDVSSLPNGFYILHVHDGIADKPEVHRILVSH
ncbi:MAG: T9SS type A sorting domain-containing protein, partial [Tannerellaceae bacterium]|nr:T9SS type A sorting domain-containing protein [Tannerellaceae bacterium]